MAGRLYRMAKVVSANPKSWGIVDANEISGFKRVAKLSDLYSIAECILSSSYGDGVTDGADAVGQIWHVSETDSDYKLTNWASRKSAAGWTKLFYGGLDTTVYKVLGTNETLPTTGIKNCIYLKLILTGNPTGDNNKYAEYVYTGDIAGTYDATKWEKLGEVTSNIDLSEYYKKTEVYNKSEIDEKTSKRDVLILDLSAKVNDNAIDTFTGDAYIATIPGDEHEDQYKLSISLKSGDVKTVYIKPATNNGSGVMTSSQKIKLDGIAVGANNYTHPHYSEASVGLYKISVDTFGHVSGTTLVTNTDIDQLVTVDSTLDTHSSHPVSGNAVNKYINNKKLTTDNLTDNNNGIVSDGDYVIPYALINGNGDNKLRYDENAFVMHCEGSTIDLRINGSTVWNDTSLRALTDTELNEILV